MNDLSINAGNDSPSGRIKQLCQIDQDIVEMLKHAGEAIKTLTGDSAQVQGVRSLDLDDRRLDFNSATDAFLKTLWSIDGGLRRQLADLKEAEILPTEGDFKPETIITEDQVEAEPSDAGMIKPNASRKNAIVAGGLGYLDTGWLNSRNGNVGKQTEAGLWREALDHIQRYTEGRGLNLAAANSTSAEANEQAQSMQEN